MSLRHECLDKSYNHEIQDRGGLLPALSHVIIRFYSDLVPDNIKLS